MLDDVPAQPRLDITFGESFLLDHAHSLLRNPDIAVVELIANAYDAGATRVDVQWPEGEGEVVVADNGTGMTKAELSHRWRTLCYNRTREQGSVVVFPPGVTGGQRAAFGQSGKGRHGMFCFAKEYSIETWKDGVCTAAVVTRTDGGKSPFLMEVTEKGTKQGHGTRISAKVDSPYLTAAMVRETLGTKFLVDPSFSVWVNAEKLELVDLRGLSSTDLDVPGCGTVRVHLVESPGRDRTTQMRGITWWVIGRMVGKPSWDGLDGSGSILDGRTTEARKLSFVVEANPLKEDVSSDWMGFKQPSSRVDAVRRVVHDHVTAELTNVLVASMVERKRNAVKANADILRPLPQVARATIGRFIDIVQQRCHRIGADDLSNLVCIVANMESARSGYDLLGKLATCSPDDIDRWNAIMEEWDANRAQIVLSELGRRLDMILKLEKRAHDPGTKELCELQPLFEANLWVFGPEYECVDFTSNRAMVTLLRKLFDVNDAQGSLKRPDFVVLPDSTIGAYAAPQYGGGEVTGWRKVLIVELKRGGFVLHQQELNQGLNYAREIRGKAGLGQGTDITVYVLGAQVGPDLDDPDLRSGSITVKPMVFSTILEMANARTFRLLQRIRETVGVEAQPKDGIVESVVNEPPLIEVSESAESRP